MGEGLFVFIPIRKSDPNLFYLYFFWGGDPMIPNEFFVRILKCCLQKFCSYKNISNSPHKNKCLCFIHYYVRRDTVQKDKIILQSAQIPKNYKIPQKSEKNFKILRLKGVCIISELGLVKLGSLL